jgi:hypothetical protein
MVASETKISSTKLWRAPGRWVGGTTYCSAQPPEAKEVEKRGGNERGRKRTVAEAFAGRKDTKPHKLEDGMTSFGMESQFCDNYT